jgi:hypothetical protein
MLANEKAFLIKYIIENGKTLHKNDFHDLLEMDENN